MSENSEKETLEKEKETEEESLDEKIIEGDEVKNPKKIETINFSKNSLETSEFENFISPPISSSITRTTKKKIKQQDILEEVAEESSFQQSSSADSKQETNYASGYNLKKYEATNQKENRRNPGDTFVLKNISLVENPQNFSQRRNNNFVLDQELQSLREQIGQRDIEKDYSSELKNLESGKRRLPFQKNLKEYRV